MTTQTHLIVFLVRSWNKKLIEAILPEIADYLNRER
jgi:hypothetical protein